MMSACHPIPYRVPSTHPLYLAVMCLSLFYGTVSFNYPRKQIETTTHFKHLLLNCLFYLENDKNYPQSSQMPITMHNRSFKKLKQKINNPISQRFSPIFPHLTTSCVFDGTFERKTFLRSSCNSFNTGQQRGFLTLNALQEFPGQRGVLETYLPTTNLFLQFTTKQQQLRL